MCNLHWKIIHTFNIFCNVFTMYTREAILFLKVYYSTIIIYFSVYASEHSVIWKAKRWLHIFHPYIILVTLVIQWSLWICYIVLLWTHGLTHLINIHTPVGSIALAIPFQEAIIEYFCLAVRGSLGSVGAGAAPSKLTFAPLSEAANFPNSQPIFSHRSNY